MQVTLKIKLQTIKYLLISNHISSILACHYSQQHRLMPYSS